MTATQTAHTSIDALTLLAELGSANCETTEQLLAAATELAASIVERLKLIADESPIFGDYRVVDSRLYSGAEFVAESRDAALRFAHDISAGLLAHFSDALAARIAESRQALSLLPENSAWESLK